MQMMRQRPLVWFYLLAFGWAWALELPILGLWHPPPGTLGDALRIIIPTLIGGPTLPAFFMTALTEGRAGMSRLLRRYVLWRVGWRWYLVVLIGAPGLILLSLLVPPGAITGLREPVPLLVVSYLPALLVIFLVGGPLVEEPGWRGFALTRLEKRFSPLVGTLLLGAGACPYSCSPRLQWSGNGPRWHKPAVPRLHHRRSGPGRHLHLGLQ